MSQGRERGIVEDSLCSLTGPDSLKRARQALERDKKRALECAMEMAQAGLPSFTSTYLYIAMVGGEVSPREVLSIMAISYDVQSGFLQSDRLLEEASEARRKMRKWETLLS